MWSYYLTNGRLEVALEEVLKVLQVADLAGNLHTFTVFSSSLVENLDCLMRVLNCLIKD